MSTSAEFVFPALYNFPPFFTRYAFLCRKLLPNDSSFAAQLAAWSAFILQYSQHHRQFTLTLTDALSSPLLHNSTLSRKVPQKFALEILDSMASDGTVEWTDVAKTSCWVWWRKPEEWAGVIYDWVDMTGQKGSVLTLFELEEGDATRKEEFHGMPAPLLRKVLGVLVKKGQAQMFGTEDEMGVKFF